LTFNYFFLRLSQNVCIDERIIGFKGRHFLKQYIANKKAHIWRVKAWVLAESNSGYTHIRSKYIKANRILRNISKRHVFPRQSDSFEMIQPCNHLRGFEHELLAQRLFPFRIIDIYWKKYQRLYLAILALAFIQFTFNNYNPSHSSHYKCIF
jgi:hypothetical protein